LQRKDKPELFLCNAAVLERIPTLAAHLIYNSIKLNFENILNYYINHIRKNEFNFSKDFVFFFIPFLTPNNKIGKL